MPLLLCDTESCSVTKGDVQSFDFIVMRFFMKIFKLSNRDLIINCIGYCNFSLPCEAVT
jgi:dTDP-4-dehydrorhamnose reductase